VAVAPAAIETDPHSVEPTYTQLFKDKRVTRISPATNVACGLALTFDNRLFLGDLHRLPKVQASHRIVTVERPLSIAHATRKARDQMIFVAEQVLGGPAVWAPTTLICRDALASVVPDWPLTEDDWQPVAPLTEPYARAALENARPVVGICRMSRSRKGAWTDMATDPETLFETPTISWNIRAAPGVPAPSWPQPAPVEFWPDEALSLGDFLSRVDILANPDRPEEDPVPVESLFALRAGVIPYLTPEYRSTFGAAALYGRREMLSQVAVGVHDDRGFLEDLRANGEVMLNGVFSQRVFTARVERLIGAPRKDAFAPDIRATPRKRVIFHSSNGVGMGHLTRQLAIARRLPGHIEPVFISHSQAVDVVREYGYIGEYIPYHAAYGQAPKHWNEALADILAEAFAFYRPSALIYDGNVPYAGLIKALDAASSLARIWIRRGMWSKGRDEDALEQSTFFDLVIEPGEFAAILDDGPTVAYRSTALCVDPVHILDSGELYSRESACDVLGLDPGNINALIAPGSGNNFDTVSPTDQALAYLENRSGVGVARADWKIANVTFSSTVEVARLTEYPFARFHNAFDFAVAAAGYNTFTEHVAAALPTIWVPNEHAQQDKQIHRATFAEKMDLGSLVRVSNVSGLEQALDAMLDTRTLQMKRDKGQEFLRRQIIRNGAELSAAAIACLSQTVIDRKQT
jgi:hypothetical protein